MKIRGYHNRVTLFGFISFLISPATQYLEITELAISSFVFGFSSIIVTLLGSETVLEAKRIIESDYDERVIRKVCESDWYCTRQGAYIACKKAKKMDIFYKYIGYNKYFHF